MKRFNEQTIARISIVIIFLALSRCLGEAYRLQFLVSKETPGYIILPFMMGAALCAVSAMIMTILSFFSKYKAIIILAIATIIALLVIKFKMM